MKKYINPETIILNVALQTIVCTSGDSGDDPANARTPGRRVGGQYI